MGPRGAQNAGATQRHAAIVPAMFTGIVQAVGRIVEARTTPAGVRLVVEAPEFAPSVDEGESICVSGVCLTNAPAADASAGGARLGFDVVSETLARSTLGGMRAGSRVNLERSVRADSPMGGHVVQGHVDAMGEVVRVQEEKADWRVRMRMARGAMECIAPKGSVAVEGVSLTVAAGDAGRDAFEVALIPHTLGATTLGELRAGSRVNVETDVLARQVVWWVRNYAGGGGAA